MNEEELVLSDVHVTAFPRTCSSDYISYKSCTISHEIKVTQSRFRYIIPESIENDDGDPTAICNASSDVTIATTVPECLHFDVDGDIEVPRNDQQFNIVTIEHGLASPLSLVGLQVWSGALILSDYLLHNRFQISDKILLELGAGSGLTSIVASKYAKLVYCTDTKDEILQLCERNVERNLSRKHGTNVIVKELDWSKSNPYEKNSGKWSWTQQDLENIKKVDLVIASDVVYSDELTDHFFKVLLSIIHCNRPVTVIISLERRLNFTLEDLEVCCPAYDHFVALIDTLKSDRQFPLIVTQINTDFAQYFTYERTKYLEIWKIESASEMQN